MLPESRKRKIRKMYGLSCTSLVSRTFFADVFSLLRCLLVLTCIEWMPTSGILNMHARALYAIYASISKHGNGKHYIFVLTVKTCRILGTREQRFLWLICSRRQHLPHDRSLCRLQLLQVRFWSWLPCSFYSTWKLRPYKVDVTLFQFVNRKIVCEFWNDSNIP